MSGKQSGCLFVFIHFAISISIKTKLYWDMGDGNLPQDLSVPRINSLELRFQKVFIKLILRQFDFQDFHISSETLEQSIYCPTCQKKKKEKVNKAGLLITGTTF